jgi:hypothetical protein
MSVGRLQDPTELSRKLSFGSLQQTGVGREEVVLPQHGFRETDQ